MSDGTPAGDLLNGKPPPARLVALISGYGSNLQAVIDACASGLIPGEIEAVIANKANAYGLERARLAGIPALVKPKRKDQDRRVYDGELADLAASFRPDWIILAGWMRILTCAFLERFPNRVVNLHPALPGAFPGTHAIPRAYEAYQAGRITQTGVMVHLVPDEGIDSGPVLAQEAVAIYPEDTLESLEGRIHQVEHRLLVDSIRSLCMKVS
jgi:formyltetrahydrofolate-dependent phosphoribosylglycinamide formyltransferase